MKSQQNESLKEIMAQKHERARVIAVASGKGGVGKTNIAANLAVCLAASNKKILLIDADLGLGNLDVILNISGRNNLWDVAEGRKTLSEAIHNGPAGVDIICGVSGIEEMANLGNFQRQRILRELYQLQDNYETIIIDTSAGINQSVIGFCGAADDVFIITTPEPSAMTDAYAMIKVLSRKEFPGRISVIVNMAGSVAEGRKVQRQIMDVARRFLAVIVYEAGVILRDERVPSAVRSREPVVLSYPKSQVTASIAAMAARLSKGCIANQEKEGFFQKVVNWFF